MPEEISPEAQQLLMQFQGMQQQFQAIALQKESFHMQKMEVDKALEELKKVKDKDDVFKSVGPILVKSTKKKMVKDLSESKETIDVRLKTLDKQETKLKDKLKALQEKLQKSFAGLEGAKKPDKESDDKAVA